MSQTKKSYFLKLLQDHPIEDHVNDRHPYKQNPEKYLPKWYKEQYPDDYLDRFWEAQAKHNPHF